MVLPPTMVVGKPPAESIPLLPKQRGLPCFCNRGVTRAVLTRCPSRVIRCDAVLRVLDGEADVDVVASVFPAAGLLPIPALAFIEHHIT
jgi:hypothetical protein